MSDPTPWPEDRPEDRAPASPALPPDDWAESEPEQPAGSRGVAIGVALGTLGFWVVLPFLVVVAVYSMLSVYAIVKAVGSAPDQPNAVAIALAIVGLVTLFIVIISVAISVIGRAADPKRRR